jgi:DNA repair protein RadC
MNTDLTQAAGAPTPSKISDLESGERPRERFAAVGAAGVSARELVAILLRNGVRGKSALALADLLLAEFGGLAGLARTDARDLNRVPGIGRVKALELKAALELGRRMAHSQLGERSQVRPRPTRPRC